MGDEVSVADRMQSSEEASLIEPPPLPPRPIDLPPPSKLPRMIANDEGEVFWYIPRRRQPREQKKASVGPEQAESASATFAQPQLVPESSKSQPDAGLAEVDT